jgi:hypothetical protein
MKNIAFAIILIFAVGCSVGFAQSTAFTYQGKLTDGGAAANGVYDLRFRLFIDLGGATQAGGDVFRDDVHVANGIFTVSLDFGTSPFTSSTGNFLEIAVRPGGSTDPNAYVRLSPLQPLTSSPYSILTIRAQTAATAAALSASCSGCVTSTQIGSVSGGAVQGQIPVTSVPAGSSSYLQNQNSTTAQTPGNFNIDGTGKANIFDATIQFNIGAQKY